MIIVVSTLAFYHDEAHTFGQFVKTTFIPYSEGTHNSSLSPSAATKSQSLEKYH